MDIEKIQKLNQMIKEYKQHNMDLDTSELSQLDTGVSRVGESSEMSESEKLARKLNFRIKSTEDEINNLKAMIEGLREEIKELKTIKKEQIQKEFNSKPENQKPVLSRREEARREIIEDVEDNTPRLTKPIDRNNVAPADVAIDKIFYFGQK